MHLDNAWVDGLRRAVTFLVGAGRDHHGARLDLAARRGHAVSIICGPAQAEDLHLRLDGRRDPDGVCPKARHDLIARHEVVRVRTVVRVTGQVEREVGAVQHEGFPAPAMPALPGDMATLQDSVLDAALREVITRREASLAGSDHDDVHLAHPRIVSPAAIAE